MSGTVTSSDNAMKRKWPRCQNRISFLKGFYAKMHLLPIFCHCRRSFQNKYSNISFIFYLIISNVMYAIKRQHLGFIAFLLHSNIIRNMLTYIYKTRKIYIRPPPFIKIGRIFFHVNSFIGEAF